MTNPVDEVRFLTDALFDGVINAAQTKRLEDFIVNDPACLQAYLEIINVHGALLSQADTQTDDEAALHVLREFSDACDRRELQNRRRMTVLSSACLFLICGTIGLLVSLHPFKPASIGSVSLLTNDAHFISGSVEPGQLLRRGKVVSLSEGVITLELSHVQLDLIGPAELKLEDQRNVKLQRGTLTARVFPGGEGFTVRTPDAEVIDLGTEFSVHHDREQGTDVSVRRGRTRASLLDTTGIPSKIVELTTKRSARLQRERGTLFETTFEDAIFEQVDQTRGMIRSLSGELRTPALIPVSLHAGKSTTLNHMLVIPERQQVTLKHNLSLKTLAGQRIFPAGSTLSSYLVHYDPTDTAKFAPRGSVTFFDAIAAIIVDGSELQATDELFGLMGVSFSDHPQRGLELELDQIQLSDDQRTASFFFGMSPPAYLDQVRILVMSGES